MKLISIKLSQIFLFGIFLTTACGASLLCNSNSTLGNNCTTGKLKW